MGGNACLIKKKMCNPPAEATFRIAGDMVNDIGAGLYDKSVLERAGLEDYLYYYSYVEESAQARCDKANAWFYENVARVERLEKPLPPPWNTPSEYKPAVKPDYDYQSSQAVSAEDKPEQDSSDYGWIDSALHNLKIIKERMPALSLDSIRDSLQEITRKTKALLEEQDQTQISD